MSAFGPERKPSRSDGAAEVGKRTPLRPGFTHSLAGLIDRQVPVRAMCDTCARFRDIDLDALAQVKGMDYDLWNKRTRCRIEPGCKGWNRFYFSGRGRFEPMRDA
ncbi:MAG: hypothetical protein KDE32_10195 [Novosphingobium sp.]|nr:hypothetical protein [Novosphingobium sp.]